MSEAAPTPAPAPAEVVTHGPNANPADFNIRQAMEDWASLPEQEAKADKHKADTEKADGLVIDGAQSNLVFTKEGEVNHAKSGKVTRVDEHGQVIHLDKRSVEKAATEIADLYGYTGDKLLTPNQAIPELRDKRIAEIKAELTKIAEHHAKGGSERVTDSVVRSRALKAELSDLTSRKHAEEGSQRRQAPQTDGGNPLDRVSDNTTPPTSDEAQRLLDGVSQKNETAKSSVEYAKAMNELTKRAKAAKEGGNWTEYQKALLDMAVLTDARNETRGSDIGEQFQGHIDKRLGEAQDGRKDRIENGGVNKYKITEALQKKLDDARSEFVRLTAVRRGKSVGSAKELAAAKEAYDKARNEAGLTVVRRLKNAGATDQEVAAFGKMGALSELEILAKEIEAVQEAKEASKSGIVRRFNEFWARNTGRKENGKINWKGVAKKAAVMAAITAIPGAGIGAAVTSVLGAVGAGASGSALGAVMSSSVARSLFRSRVNHAGEMRTGASVYRDALVSENEDLRGAETNLEAADVTDRVMAQTEQLVGKNRRRHLGAVALGAVGAVGGYYAAKGVRAGIGAAYDHFRGHASGGRSAGVKSDIDMGDKHNNGFNPKTASRDVGDKYENGYTGTSNGNSDSVPNIPPKIDTSDPVGGVGNPEGAIPSGLIDTSKWKYPYNWVEDIFKGEDPVRKIHQLEEAARNAGYKVEIHKAGTPSEWVSINGISDTAYVVNILNSVKDNAVELPVTA